MKYILITFLSINILNACVELTMPPSNINEGFAYQGTAPSFEVCQSAAMGSGDGLGLSFLNPNTDTVECKSGYCFYNKPSAPTNDDKYDVQQLIPYIDDIESKNQGVIDELQNLDTNLSNNFTTLDDNFEKIDDTLENIDEKLENEKTQNQSLNDVADNYEMDLNIDSELSSLERDYKDTLSDTFSNYSNVFGIGGYGSAPSSISFNLLGRSYTVFDISYISAYVNHIRNIFLACAYLFGIFLVFKGN
ncbi:MAG: hypothetical protein WA916_06075 [Arcobacter sp.]|uniref:hypothetical protein n=1 Tax=Arcobacter sp. TaxID=1872629 RepID=UPI003C73EEA7